MNCGPPWYRIPWCVTKVAIRAERTMLVPPLKRQDCMEKVPSFQRLDPPLDSKNLACLRQATSGSLISYSKSMLVVGVVCWYRCFNSFLFPRPRKPCPRL